MLRGGCGVYVSRPSTLHGKNDFPGGMQPVQQRGQKREDTIVGRQDGCQADRLTQTCDVHVLRILNLAPGYEPVLETLFSVFLM